MVAASGKLVAAAPDAIASTEVAPARPTNGGSPATAPKLTIENGVTPPPAATARPTVTPTPIQKPAATAAATAGATQPGGIKLTGLAAMKQALAAKQSAEVVTSIPVTLGALSVYWEEFIDTYRQAKRTSVVSNLQLAEIQLPEPQEIALISRNIVMLRFLEEEKLAISEFFKQKFRNKDLTVTLLLDESKQQEQVDAGPQRLSSKEQYLKMVEKYPLIRELKDSLGMELDF
ncbi:hypothetical protein MKQ68_18230 [Chitinophaga horti]|uniref:DNA polymerase-3 subunit gamma/tau n=1 Tax=Chitinophaga horti TaxID=2920382 RepID=A0ABY6J1K6_9BACT|nr:hypothetical protein [Chitinophaga horti]UYQ92027.1 hypothetical protein MKQ68_18230 [Chitinophaga horti]